MVRTPGSLAASLLPVLLCAVAPGLTGCGSHYHAQHTQQIAAPSQGSGGATRRSNREARLANRPGLPGAENPFAGLFDAGNKRGKSPRAPSASSRPRQYTTAFDSGNRRGKGGKAEDPFKGL